MFSDDTDEFWIPHPHEEDESHIMHYSLKDIVIEKNPAIVEKTLAELSPVPIFRIAIQLTNANGIYLAGVYLIYDNHYYASPPQRNQELLESFNFTVERTGWRTSIPDLFFKHDTEIADPRGNVTVGLYCSSLTKCDVKVNLIVFGAICNLEPKIAAQKIPLISRLIPRTTTCHQGTFVGHTLNGKTIWEYESTEVARIALSPTTEFVHLTPYQWSNASVIGSASKMYKLNAVSGRWVAENDEVNDLLSTAYLSLMECLRTTTIRNQSLLRIFWALADRNGIGYPVAVVGGAVRDILTRKEPDDVDIVVGGHYKELEDYLRDFFVSQGESVGKNTLFTKPKSKQFGQLKIMKTEVDRKSCALNLLT